jgi:hypothetical protein
MRLLVVAGEGVFSGAVGVDGVISGVAGVSVVSPDRSAVRRSSTSEAAVSPSGIIAVTLRAPASATTIESMPATCE